MRASNLVENTGAILTASDHSFIGTSFIFRFPNYSLTAKHCVASGIRTDFVLAYPHSKLGQQPLRIRDLHLHPTADLAIIRTEDIDERKVTYPVIEAWGEDAFGENILSLGYPQDTVISENRLALRVFKGHVQRNFLHKSFMGESYTAMEVSFSAPRGLSGAAVVHETFQGRLYGIVTENIRTESERETLVQVEEGKSVYKEVAYRLVSFGVALLLGPHREWINGIVPRLTNDEEVRRANNQHRWKKEDAALKL